MSKTVKTILALVGSVIALAVIAVMFLASNIDGIVKQIVEEVGTETLGTKVSLNSVEISLKDAKGALNGLKIANPEGFKEANAFELNGIAVDLDAKSLSGDEVALNSIIIDQAALTFEQSGNKNNLKTLLNNMDSEASTDGSTPDSSDTAEEDILLVIDELQLKGAKMTVVSDQLGKPLSLTLDDITVRNIGQRGAGVTPDEAAEQIIEPVLKAAEQAALNSVKEQLKARAKEKAEEEKGKFLDSAKKKIFGD